ncbi:PTS glucose transporter subunit IIA [Lactiplantibacillus garii]|uniref:PTS glucose transporter subunit IIA n=1 Tax=Lactiplantibacillus garii TaxID=2306423 RepID=A0A3R8LLR4_9LACO|nr:PTS glucitol/sorbitol transporter subunit IIA [Lactiplantibacillus garii]RRK11554.1 PTS glucose transporter subunit IIA [Lactiplantibacillus garii]
MATTATVSAIGANAIDPKEPILVFFDETATESIQQIAVIQKFDAPVKGFSLEKGSKVKIDDQTYTVAFAGGLVAANLTSIGHATLYFSAVPAKPMENGVYLTPTTMPTIHVGSVITYLP